MSLSSDINSYQWSSGHCVPRYVVADESVFVSGFNGGGFPANLRPYAVCCGCVWIRCQGHMEAGDGIFHYANNPLWDCLYSSIHIYI